MGNIGNLPDPVPDPQNKPILGGVPLDPVGKKGKRRRKEREGKEEGKEEEKGGGREGWPAQATKFAFAKNHNINITLS